MPKLYLYLPQNMLRFLLVSLKLYKYLRQVRWGNYHP